MTEDRHLKWSPKLLCTWDWTQAPLCVPRRCCHLLSHSTFDICLLFTCRVTTKSDNILVLIWTFIKGKVFILLGIFIAVICKNNCLNLKPKVQRDQGAFKLTHSSAKCTKAWNRHPNSKFKIWNIRIWNSKYSIWNSKYVFGISNTYLEFQIAYFIFWILNLDGGSRLSYKCDAKANILAYTFQVPHNVNIKAVALLWRYIFHTYQSSPTTVYIRVYRGFHGLANDMWYLNSQLALFISR